MTNNRNSRIIIHVLPVIFQLSEFQQVIHTVHIIQRYRRKAHIFTNKFPEDKFNHDDFVVVSPDVGSVTRARAFAAKVHMGLAIVDKRRPKANVCEVMNVIGDVKGKTCIMYDDIVDTAGSLCNAAKAIYDKGATKVYACATHAVLSGPAIGRIEESVIKEVLFLDTIPPKEGQKCDKIKYLSAAPMLADAMSFIYHETSVSRLFV